jgi:hypothetical protein
MSLNTSQTTEPPKPRDTMQTPIANTPVRGSYNTPSNSVNTSSSGVFANQSNQFNQASPRNPLNQQNQFNQLNQINQINQNQNQNQLNQLNQPNQNQTQNQSNQPIQTTPTELPWFAGNVDEKFPELSYLEVQSNLRFLSDVKEGEKIIIDSDRKNMMIDQRILFQWARRSMFNDSRFRTLLFTQHLIDNAKRYCAEAVELIRKNIDHKDNMQKLIKLQGLLRTAGDGLGRLLITYADDKQSKAKIITYIDAIRVFCDQDMEKVVTL